MPSDGHPPEPERPARPQADPDADRQADPEAEPDVEPEAAGAASPGPRPHARGGSVLGAAMLGLGQVLEPEKAKVVIEHETDDPFADADLGLTFGELPSLDDP